MNKKKQIITAFKMWQHMAELESILWDLYYEDFLDLCAKQDNANCSKKDTPDVEYPLIPAPKITEKYPSKHKQLKLFV